ncbi:hypothetical protein HAX54_002611 [Datura stramonium]|uniref:Uncharacterized protein n=1 Tax=Datura stramonium TaxID=4076 RepID=A0ABS8T450_DATST|nr:hypothetical protein [Datura stramonium]
MAESPKGKKAKPAWVKQYSANWVRKFHPKAQARDTAKPDSSSRLLAPLGLSHTLTYGVAQVEPSVEDGDRPIGLSGDSWSIG